MKLNIPEIIKEFYKSDNKEIKILISHETYHLHKIGYIKVAKKGSSCLVSIYDTKDNPTKYEFPNNMAMEFVGQSDPIKNTLKIVNSYLKNFEIHLVENIEEIDEDKNYKVIYETLLDKNGIYYDLFLKGNKQLIDKFKYLLVESKYRK